MRLYLALKVPDLHLTDERFRKLRAGLQKQNIDFSWTPSDQLHIPLAGLGDVGRGTFLSLFNRLKDVVKHHRPMELKLSGLWAHPYQKEADMLWIGVQNSRQLRDLEQDLGEALNIDADDFIRPHIPLIQLSREKDVTDLVSPFKNIDFGSVLIDDIRLVEKVSGTSGIRMLGSHSLYQPPTDNHEVL